MSPTYASKTALMTVLSMLAVPTEFASTRLGAAEPSPLLGKCCPDRNVPLDNDKRADLILGIIGADQGWVYFSKAFQHTFSLPSVNVSKRDIRDALDQWSAANKVELLIGRRLVAKKIMSFDFLTNVAAARTVLQQNEKELSSILQLAFDKLEFSYKGDNGQTIVTNTFDATASPAKLLRIDAKFELMGRAGQKTPCLISFYNYGDGWKGSASVRSDDPPNIKSSFRVITADNYRAALMDLLRKSSIGIGHPDYPHRIFSSESRLLEAVTLWHQQNQTKLNHNVSSLLISVRQPGDLDNYLIEVAQFLERTSASW